jgi:succinate dehydrogenase hydrophobic anchor subunit
MLHHAFRVFVAFHLVTGSVGLLLFWVTGVFGKKGAPWHKRFGRVFVACMLFTGSMAVALSTLTLIDPMQTHPHFVEHPVFRDPQLVRGLFGWMMQFLALLTISLAWHGWGAVRHKRDHAANRRPLNVALQVVVILTALNTAWHGWQLQQAVMLGLPIVGVASGATNLWFAFQRAPKRYAHMIEHVKALVGAAISGYTAFLAFGLVRLMPEQVFSPVLWSIPLGTGLSIIIWHFVRFLRMRARANAAAAPVSAAARGSGFPSAAAS